jgi:hypothetical protein
MVNFEQTSEPGGGVLASIWECRAPVSHMEAEAIRTKRDDADVRLGIEAALARRHDKFVLSDLSWTADGYTVKFRRGVMDIVMTAVEAGAFEDSWRMDRMLDSVGLMFQSYSPL